MSAASAATVQPGARHRSVAAVPAPTRYAWMRTSAGTRAVSYCRSGATRAAFACSWRALATVCGPTLPRCDARGVCVQLARLGDGLRPDLAVGGETIRLLPAFHRLRIEAGAAGLVEARRGCSLVELVRQRHWCL